MEYGIFLLSIYCLIFTVYSKGVIINENDIIEFRAKNHVEPIDDLLDLNENSTDVKAILTKIGELEVSGFDLLNKVPDNGATCSIKIKYYIAAIVKHAKLHCDSCVAQYVNKESPLELNADQKKCSLGVLETANHELETISARIKPCIDNTFV